MEENPHGILKIKQWKPKNDSEKYKIKIKNWKNKKKYLFSNNKIAVTQINSCTVTFRIDAPYCHNLSDIRNKWNAWFAKRSTGNRKKNTQITCQVPKPSTGHSSPLFSTTFGIWDAISEMQVTRDKNEQLRLNANNLGDGQ